MKIRKWPKTKHSVIYADPPWKYSDQGDSGKRGAKHKYPVMNIRDIMRLDVESIAEDDCTLFMWHVPVMPLEALKVIDAWGFKLKTMKGFTWIKLNKLFAQQVRKHFHVSPEELKVMDDAGILSLMNQLTKMGMGNWTRANSEDCLIATRGNPKRIDASIKNTVFAPIGRHSEKPGEIRQRIVDLMGDVSRIELFARENAEGWAAWGNEV